MKRPTVCKTDEYGIQEWHPVYLILLAFLTLYTCISVLSGVLYYFESGAPNGNIHNYADAFWCLQMAASTIGFGDHYPVTTWGRWTTALMFYIGVGMAAGIGTILYNWVFGRYDQSVKNRELRAQNAAILEEAKQMHRDLDDLRNELRDLVMEKADTMPRDQLDGDNSGR